MVDGGHLENLQTKNRDISKTVRPIMTKFCTMTHISRPELTSCSENQTFKNLRWWMAAILKFVKCDMQATDFGKIWYGDAY